MSPLNEPQLQERKRLSSDQQEKVDRLRDEIATQRSMISSYEDEIADAEEAIEQIEHEIEEITLNGAIDASLGERLDGILHIADWAEADDLPLYDRRDVDRLVAALAHELRDAQHLVAREVRAAHHAVWLELPTEEVVDHIHEAKTEWAVEHRRAS